VLFSSAEPENTEHTFRGHSGNGSFPKAFVTTGNSRAWLETEFDK